MAVVTIGTAVDLTLLKMKWREQYVSEGLNRKTIPDGPRGIYRGLRLAYDATQGGTDRRVAVVADPDGTHEAVYQNTTGHSLTYIDNDGSSMIFDLAAPGLNGTDVVIALYVDYQIGADTTAEWRAYPEADYLALPAAEKDELIILGMVKNLVALTPVVAGDIFVERRTMAWENRAAGGKHWAPLVEAPGFEVGGNGNGKYDIAHWIVDTTGGNGTWDLTGDANSGEQGLRVTSVSGASFASTLRRDVGIHLEAAQMLRYRLYKKVQTATTAGSVELGFDFSDSTLSAAVVSHTIAIPATTTNPGFIEIEGLFTPEEAGITTSVLLRSIYLSVSGVDATTAIDFDDVQVWAEEVDGSDPSFQGRENIGGVKYASPLFLMGKGDVFSAADQGAVLNYDNAEVDVVNPANVDPTGAVATTEASPDIRQRGGMFVGEGKLRNAGEVDTARIETAVSATAGQRTCIWQSSGGTQYESRIYVGAGGEAHYVSNASFSNTTLQWSADDSAAPASRMWQVGGTWYFQRKDDTSVAWSDASWDAHQPLELGDDPLAKIFLSDNATQVKQALVVEEDPAAGGTFSALVEIRKNSDSGSGAPALLVQKQPPTGTGSTGPAFKIETGVNQYDNAMFIDHDGTDSAILLNHSAAGVGHGIDLNADNAGSGDALNINKSGGSGEAISITCSGAGEALYINNSNSNNAIEVVNSTTSTAVYIDQNGSGTAMEINNDSTGYGLFIDQNSASSSYGLYIDSASTINAAARIRGDCPTTCQIVSDATGGTTLQVVATLTNSGNMFDILGRTSDHQARMQFINYGRVRFDGNDGNSGSMFQTASSYASLSGDLIQHTSDRGSSTAFNLMRMFASGGSDPKFRVDGSGRIYADNGSVGTPADYAEFVEVVLDKSNYEPGDVMAFSGGEMLFDKSASANSAMVAGVYSTEPLVLGNSSSGCDEHNCDMASGTLEVASWEMLTIEGDPDSTNWNRISISGDRTADYTVDGAVRFDSTASSVIENVTYDGVSDKTIVLIDQHFPKAFDSTTKTLHYGVTGRNMVPMAMLGQVPTKCITENGTIAPGDLLVTSSTPGRAMKAGPSPAIGTIVGKAMETLTDTGAGTDTASIMVYVNLH